MTTRIFDAAGRLKHAVMPAADEFEYWTAQAAMLDPSAMTYTSGGAFSFTVPADKTYYLFNAWNARHGSTGPTMFLRDPRSPMPMAPGMNLQGNGTSGAFAYYCDPSAVSTGAKYADPKGLYFERLARLKHLQTYNLGGAITAGAAFATLSTPAFPSDFTDALLIQADSFDTSWVALGTGASIINLNDEISDDHAQRFASSLMVPFKRATFNAITTRGGNIAGTATACVAGTASVTYKKLPSDW